MPRKTSTQMTPDSSERIVEAVSLCFTHLLVFCWSKASKVQNCILVQVFQQESSTNDASVIFCPCPNLKFLRKSEHVVTEWRAAFNISVQEFDFVCFFWDGLNTVYVLIFNSNTFAYLYISILPQPPQKKHHVS